MKIHDQLTIDLKGEFAIPECRNLLEYADKRFSEPNLMYYLVKASGSKHFNALVFARVHNTVREAGIDIPNFMLFQTLEQLAQEPNYGYKKGVQVYEAAEAMRDVLKRLSDNAIPLQLIDEAGNESDALRRKIESIKDLLFADGHETQGQQLEDAMSGLDQVDNELDICRSYYELRLNDDDINW